MKSIRKAILFFAAMGFTAFMANAAVLTASGSIGTPTSLTIPFNSIIAIDAFDTDLGTLTSINVLITGDAEVSFTASDTSGSDITFSGILGAEESIAVPGGSVLAIVFPGITFPTTTIFASSPYLLNGGTPESVSDSRSGNVASVDFALFQQAGGCNGCIQLPVVGTNNTSLTNTGTWLESDGITVDAQATVTYNYDPAGIPEPATMTMQGCALIGVGFLARKKLRR